MTYRPFLCALVLMLALGQAHAQTAAQEPVSTSSATESPTHPASQTQVPFPVPPAVREEHKDIQAELDSIVRMQDPVGAAARKLEAVLRPHFEKEEQIALPPLGLLEPLAHDDVSSQMAAILPLTSRLRGEMPQMLAEHKQIVQALEPLRQQARLANRVEVIRFADGLEHHARVEEQVLYPAALVVGRFVELKSQPQAAPSQPHP